MIARAKSNPKTAWLSYGAGTVSFLALCAYVLSLRPGRDARWMCELFMLTHPILTLPVVVTLFRIRNRQRSQSIADAKIAGLTAGDLAVAFLVGALPAGLLAVGRFAVTIPNEPPEFPLFFVLAATTSIYLILAKRWSKELAQVDRQPTADVTDQSVPDATQHDSRKRRRVKRWAWFATVAVAWGVSMIPYSPVFYGRGLVGVVLVAFYLWMAGHSLSILIKSVRTRRNFAVEMATSAMSLYSATGLTLNSLSNWVIRSRSIL